jgi:pilus assembly protein Flp/PilA
MSSTIWSFLKDDRGATAIEYGLLITLIAVAIIAGLKLLGPSINGAFNTISNTLNSH